MPADKYGKIRTGPSIGQTKNGGARGAGGRVPPVVAPMKEQNRRVAAMKGDSDRAKYGGGNQMETVGRSAPVERRPYKG